MLCYIFNLPYVKYYLLFPLASSLYVYSNQLILMSNCGVFVDMFANVPRAGYLTRPALCASTRDESFATRRGTAGDATRPDHWNCRGPNAAALKVCFRTSIVILSLSTMCALFSLLSSFINARCRMG